MLSCWFRGARVLSVEGLPRANSCDYAMCIHRKTFNGRRKIEYSRKILCGLHQVSKAICSPCRALDVDKCKASDSRDGTPLWKGRFYMKETAWQIYRLDVAVFKKNMRPDSKVPNALPKASERTTSLEGVVLSGHDLLRPGCH